MSAIPKTLTREFKLERVKAETREVELSFSSEYPVERSFGLEILSHAPGAVDLSRLNTGGALLENHDLNRQIGVVTSARIVQKRGKATVKFSRSQIASEVFQDVQDGVKSLVSVSYDIGDVKPLGEKPIPHHSLDTLGTFNRKRARRSHCRSRQGSLSKQTPQNRKYERTRNCL
jgi:hypothetical protein